MRTTISRRLVLHPVAIAEPRLCPALRAPRWSVPADTKGEYVDIIRALGGAVMGPGTLNPLDLGAMGEVAASLTGTARHAEGLSR